MQETPDKKDTSFYLDLMDTHSLQSHASYILNTIAKWMQEKAYDLTSRVFLERGRRIHQVYYGMDFIWAGVI